MPDEAHRIERIASSSRYRIQMLAEREPAFGEEVKALLKLLKL
jgi:hypothetical protein